MATPFELELIFGMEPRRESGDGKVTMFWTMENENEEVFTVYDWKYYRKIDMHETAIWNIGGHRKEATRQAREEIMQALEMARFEWVQIQ
jgi:hypothetical protein